MPSKFKRINLTVPPEVYHALCLYQKAYDLDNDAGTALSLVISVPIVRQLPEMLQQQHRP